MIEEGLNCLLNEAFVIDLALDEKVAACTLVVYCEMLPDAVPRRAEDLYLAIVFQPVKRMIVWMRRGRHWHDQAAEVQSLDSWQLSAAVGRIKNPDAMCGDGFVSRPDGQDWRRIGSKPSLQFSRGGMTDSARKLTIWTDDLSLFSEQRWFFDASIWFESLAVMDRAGRMVDIEQVIECSQRYWRAVETAGSGGPSPYPVAPIRMQIPDFTYGTPAPSESSPNLP
jgi:hypothetical protein